MLKLFKILEELLKNLLEMVTDADTYIVNFPPNADANDKLLLTGLSLMIDYQFFETDASDNHRGRRRRRRTYY